jgi:hypothetical protein
MGEKYISENCFEYLFMDSCFIEDFKITGNQLHLIFDRIAVLPDHPLNTFETEWDTNEVKLVFYDFEVIECGYYDCKDVQKQELIIEEDCSFIPLTFIELIKNFTIVSEEIKKKTDAYFEHYFGGFAWDYDEQWGFFKVRYKRMEACWDSFNNNL